MGKSTPKGAQSMKLSFETPAFGIEAQLNDERLSLTVCNF